jgi:hypothetical protein
MFPRAAPQRISLQDCEPSFATTAHMIAIRSPREHQHVA